MHHPTKTILCSFLVFFFTISSAFAQNFTYNDISNYEKEVQKIIDAALNDEQAFDKLTLFVDKFGHRFSGSESLENSIDWIVTEMKKQPFDTVFTQKVMVPHWV